MSGSPFPAGNQPSAIVVDSGYPYAYVANALDGTVSAYSIGSSGALTRIGTYAAGIQPVAIGIDPSTHHFLFTANFTPGGTSGTVSDFELSATAGTLINTQHSPYTDQRPADGHGRGSARQHDAVIAATALCRAL